MAPVSLNRLSLALVGTLIALIWIEAASASSLKRDEAVVFFPTAARLDADQRRWIVPIHAWVFEPEEDSLSLRALLASLAEALELTADQAVESTLFRDRARWFLVDNERGKTLDITLSPEARDLGPSGSDGHLEASIKLARRDVAVEDRPLRQSFALQPPRGVDLAAEGEVTFVPASGLSVISDIDDTVKISEVTDKQALLANTFLEPFRAVPNLPALYRDLEAQGAAFHYVSSSPWQLYPPLAAFFDEVGLPRGSFHLRDFRVKDRSFLGLFESSRKTKPPTINYLFESFPSRQFVLIGDSGEADPEIYGAIARNHSARVRAILIRNVTGEAASAERFVAEAFAGLPRDLWLLFDEVDEARAFLESRL